jgi:hypothetical protein
MKLLPLAALLTLPLLALGCSSEASTEAAPPARPGLPATFWLDAAQGEAVGVRSARESAEDGAEVTVSGHLQDFGDLATFRMVDLALAPCTDQCPTPWDFCCEDPADLTVSTINVEFLDGDLPGSWALKGERGLDHLTQVQVTGTLRRDGSGNVRLEASRIAKL